VEKDRKKKKKKKECNCRCKCRCKCKKKKRKSFSEKMKAKKKRKHEKAEADDGINAHMTSFSLLSPLVSASFLVPGSPKFGNERKKTKKKKIRRKQTKKTFFTFPWSIFAFSIHDEPVLLQQRRGHVPGVFQARPKDLGRANHGRSKDLVGRAWLRSVWGQHVWQAVAAVGHARPGPLLPVRRQGPRRPREERRVWPRAWPQPRPQAWPHGSRCTAARPSPQGRCRSSLADAVFLDGARGIAIMDQDTPPIKQNPSA
jgi:hypothetical protein